MLLLVAGPFSDWQGLGLGPPCWPGSGWRTIHTIKDFMRSQVCRFHHVSFTVKASDNRILIRINSKCQRCGPSLNSDTFVWKASIQRYENTTYYFQIYLRIFINIYRKKWSIIFNKYSYSAEYKVVDCCVMHDWKLYSLESVGALRCPLITDKLN